MRPRSARAFARGLTDAFHLPRTASRIVDLLLRSSRQLSVSEIVRPFGMSERGVRGNFALLLRTGILERDVVVTAKKRLAYLYRPRPREELVQAAGTHFARTLGALGKAAFGRTSPRTASSSRS